MFLAQTDFNEVDKFIKLMKPKKSFGYDKISSHFIKGIGEIIVEPFVVLIKYINSTIMFQDC